MNPWPTDLSALVAAKLHELFDGRSCPDDLYDAVMAPCEAALLVYLEQRLKSNQVHMARAHGINRNTLRKKLIRHGLLGVAVRVAEPRRPRGDLHHLRAQRRAAAAGMYEGSEG